MVKSTALTKELNKLERAVLSYTSTDCELALLKVDGLFFDTVYADLMCLLGTQ